MEFISLIPFLLFFLVIILIGVFSAKFSSRGIAEFFLGGRQMGRFVVALSSVVSGRSAWLLTGVVGLAYMKGVVALFAITGYTIIEFFLLMYYAPRIRIFSEKHDCLTIPDFFVARFGDHKHRLRLLLIFIFVVFMVTYVSAQFLAGGKAFSAHFGLSVPAGIGITAGIVLLYTLLGGFLAVSLTDVFQAIFMIIALVALPVIAIHQFGGTQILLADLKGTDINLLHMAGESLLYLAGLLAIGLGSPGNPHILVRYMSIKDPRQFRWTAVVATIWNILLGGGAVAIGMLARAYFPEASLLENSDPENAYIMLSQQVLSPFMTGLILASIFAAIMSTADSQLLVAASSVVRDLYDKIIRKGHEVSDRKMSAISRGTIMIMVLVSLALALVTEDQVMWFVLFAWAGLGAAIGPTSILALFWKKTTRQGVIAGLITGALVVFIWK